MILPNAPVMSFALLGIGASTISIPFVSSFQQQRVSLRNSIRRTRAPVQPVLVHYETITGPTSTECRGWVGDLWEEIIEFSTLGPGERKLLAERRKRKAEATSAATSGEMTFTEARKRFDGSSDGSGEYATTDVDVDDDDLLSLAAFRAARAATATSATSKDDDENNMDSFDGYALRDLLVDKWGAPLDIDFVRDMASPISLPSSTKSSSVCCTVLPVAYGQRRCRHESELEYLMHLQGVVEVLRQYNNLGAFVDFVTTTNKTPKAGTDSVPFRLILSDDELGNIL